MKCEYCGKEHDGSYGSGRFCSKSCAKGFSTKAKRKEMNRKLSEKNMGKRYIGNGVQVVSPRLIADRSLRKRCLYCGKFTSGRFCSEECKIKYQANSSLPMNKCEYCGKETRNKRFCSRFCLEQAKQLRQQTLTLQDFVNRGKHPRVRFNGIRSEARLALKKAGIEKKCCICGFDVVVEVHHIRAVTDFPFSATIAEVNDLSNLLYLCPNHHVMVDKGLITTEELNKYRYKK